MFRLRENVQRLRAKGNGGYPEVRRAERQLYRVKNGKRSESQAAGAIDRARREAETPAGHLSAR